MALKDEPDFDLSTQQGFQAALAAGATSPNRLTDAQLMEIRRKLGLPTPPNGQQDGSAQQ